MNNQDKSRNLEVLTRKIFDLGQTIGYKSAKNGPTSVDGIRDLCSKEFLEAEGLIVAIKAIALSRSFENTGEK